MKSRAKTFWEVCLFLGPNLGGFVVFMAFPVLMSFALAFTNWSLKPAVGLEFVGLRNFGDLLLFRPLDGSAGGPLPLAYLGAGLVCCLGVLGVLWAQISSWRGLRLGGALLATLGAALVLAGAATQAPAGGQGLVLAGLVALLTGVLHMRLEPGQDETRPWGPGPALLPPLLIAAGAAALWAMHGAMFATYAPRDARFWQYLYNTLFLMIGIPFSVLGSLLLAMMLNERFALGPAWGRTAGAGLCLLCGAVSCVLLWRAGMPNWAVIGALFWLIAALGFAFGVVAFRTLFYLPSFTSGVALMILWKALYNPRVGPINAVLEQVATFFNLPYEAPNWLGSVALAKPALVFMGVWATIGGMNMLLYLAALTNIPAELTEAAKVDGASPWNRLRHVIWPQLAPTTFFISVMSIIGGLQGGFDQARVMTAGGPAGSTTTLSYYIYLLAFQNLDLGYAAAISWVLFTIILLATLINWRFGREVEQ